MREGFVTTADTAMLFFRFCGRYKIHAQADRVAVLREITRRGKAKYLRDADAFVQGKRIVKIQPKRGNA